MGMGQVGAPKAEGMLAFLQGPGAGQGMRARQMGLDRPCGRAGLQERYAYTWPGRNMALPNW